MGGGGAEVSFKDLFISLLCGIFLGVCIGSRVSMYPWETFDPLVLTTQVLSFQGLLSTIYSLFPYLNIYPFIF